MTTVPQLAVQPIAAAAAPKIPPQLAAQAVAVGINPSQFTSAAGLRAAISAATAAQTAAPKPQALPGVSPVSSNRIDFSA